MYVGVFYFSHKVGGTYLNICSFDISNRSIEECVYHRCFICVKSQSLSPREIAFTPSDCIEQIFADITARTSHEHTSKLTTRQVAVLLRKLFCGLKIFKRLFWRTHFVLNVKKLVYCLHQTRGYKLTKRDTNQVLTKRYPHF